MVNHTDQMHDHSIKSAVPDMACRIPIECDVEFIRALLKEFFPPFYVRAQGEVDKRQCIYVLPDEASALSMYEQLSPMSVSTTTFLLEKMHSTSHINLKGIRDAAGIVLISEGALGLALAHTMLSISKVSIVVVDERVDLSKLKVVLSDFWDAAVTPFSLFRICGKKTESKPVTCVLFELEDLRLAELEKCLLYRKVKITGMLKDMCSENERIIQSLGIWASSLYACRTLNRFAEMTFEETTFEQISGMPVKVVLTTLKLPSLQHLKLHRHLHGMTLRLSVRKSNIYWRRFWKYLLFTPLGADPNCLSYNCLLS
ncbi:hypothetical protein DSO57_1018042 [Entomophthora muscae]|uniref:Uncharacterized protein n=2 Tax=Entomophthora muscae TaxID=34485 RepID=A0ACC2UQ70_9FUNG|nr:hypothetical protein DSO57_1018042 [Entomophthora muscae]